MFNHPWFGKVMFAVMVFVVNLLLVVVGFFTAKTYSSIERLASEVNRLSAAVITLQAGQITRAEIRQIVADYHGSKPCVYCERNKAK